MRKLEAAVRHTNFMELIFPGILFGVAIRTKKPVAIPLAPIIWKIVVGEEVTVDDLEEVDVMYVKSLQSIRDHTSTQFNEENFHEVSPDYS